MKVEKNKKKPFIKINILAQNLSNVWKEVEYAMGGGGMVGK